MASLPPSADEDSDLERCAVIARRRPSTLVEQAALFPPQKQRIFLPCYAAMRLIDDTVDSAPAAAKDAMPAVLDRWLERTLDACDGKVSQQGDANDAVFRALARVLPRSTIGTHPWHALHDAMRRDFQHVPMIEWTDFEDYCEGATVAPTYIYLVLLTAGSSENGLVARLDAATLWQHAHYLGTYCYLVHIIRDYEKDAKAGAHLLTIPKAAYCPPFEDRQALAHAWSTGLDQRGRAVLRSLDERARGIEPDAVASAKAVAAFMDAAERRMLGSVFGHYRSLLSELHEQYDLA